MTIQPVNLAVSCTGSKSLAVPASCRLGGLAARGSLESRASAWVERLALQGHPRRPALDLYQGAHWQAVRGVLNSHPAASVWVCSAGFGLVSVSATLCSYSATFSAGHPDSVGSSEERARWWELLAAWTGPETGTPRSLAGLAGRFPARPLLVALSEPYLAAVTADLCVARDLLERPELLSILCVGSPVRHPLAGHFLPVTARIRALVGGALVSLNARLAARLFDEHRGEWVLPALRRRVARWTKSATTHDLSARRRLPDGEVRAFIREELARSPAGSPSALLRRFRELGLACEQGRFARLFRQESSGHGQGTDHPPPGAAPVAG
jgi:hypothetical protein